MDRAALAHLRHEVRTPLNHIIGYSEMLQEEAQDRGQKINFLQGDMREMAFEEAFGIEVPQADVERIRTVKDAIEYVLSRTTSG
jgi:signal transduction histidine kinase